MKAHLDQLEREAVRILGQLRRLETLSVPSVSKLLRKPKKFVRANLPVVIFGPKSHAVRAADIEAFLQKRTVFPINGDKQL